MGGSSNGGVGGGIWVSHERCGDEFVFLVTINIGNMQKVWDNCSEGDRVVIQITNDAIPKMLVIRELDGFVIGVVPPSSSGLLNCIKNGWKYQGKIINKVGNEHNTQIRVMVKGEK